MADLNSTALQDIVAGNSINVEREIGEIPAGDTLEVVWLTVKHDSKDSDASAIVQKRITITASPDGQILDPGAGDRVGQIVIYLTPDDTREFLEDINYPWDLKTKTVNGKLSTPEMGILKVKSAVTLTEA